MEVWIAFGCGLLIGSCLGILCLGLVGLNRTTRLWDELDISNNRVEELEAQRELLKQEIFRLTKNYKPRKPQPRLRRNLKKNNKKKYTKK
tara:strand:+ start:203 stop:472 length:270 start_codon:yes stop_codon:yes gene_type:complete